MKMKLFSSFILSLCAVMGFSQTILYQAETITRTVQDPQTVVLAQGFQVSGSVSNPFVAKIGPGTENPGGGPADSNAGANNPSGTTTSSADQKFHDTKGNIEVNGAGQLQFTLPIALPPGVKSVAPQINLVYTSGSANGIAGYGWNVSGITSISRIGKNIEKDGEVSGVKLDYSDYYSFNGQRLILKSGVYGQDGAEYVTEKYSNIKIKSVGTYPVNGQLAGPAHFEVTFEDGSQAWYGAYVSGSRTNPEITTPLEYNIVKWKDTQGNLISYGYESTANLGGFRSPGIVRISTIYWGGNETLNKPHFNSIEFVYTDRTFNEETYVQGLKFTQNKLLSEIKVSTNGSQFKRYGINYTQNGTSYKFINSITEYNSNNEPATPVTFTYPASVQQGLEFAANNIDNFDNVKFAGDFNGDSYLDFVMNNGTMKLGAFNDTFTDITTNKTFNSDAKIVNSLIDEEGQVYNGNGIIQYENGYICGYIFKDNTFVKVFNKLVYDGDCDPGAISCSKTAKFEIGDVDGDGIEDVFISLAQRQCFSSGGGGLEPIEGKLPIGTECHTIDLGNFIVDLKNANNPLSNYTLDSGIVETSYTNQKYMDIDGDGKVDIINLTNSNYTAFEFVKTAPDQYLKKIKFSGNLIEGKPNDAPVLFGDFNGDGNLDFTIPTTDTQEKDNWRFYMGTEKGFSNFLKTNFLKYRKPNDYENADHPIFNIYRNNYSVTDINKDGKSDIIHINAFNKAGQVNSNGTIITRYFGYNIAAYVVNGGLSDGSQDFSSGLNFGGTNYVTFDTNELNLFSPITSQIKANNNYYNVFLFWKERVHKLKAPSSIKELAQIKSINQGGITTTINYKELNPDVDSNFYKKVKKEYYPYFSFIRADQSYAVSQLFQEGRKQDYRYRGMTGHLQGKGMVGYHQMARSSWYTANLEHTKIWSGVEIDPVMNGVPVKEWSIRTTDENKIFPVDISQNNAELLSFKSNQYDNYKLLNGLPVTGPVSQAENANIVLVNLVKEVKIKDFLTGIITINNITYGDYYLPMQNISNVNNGYGIKTSTFTYTHNPSGVGTNYYVGRLSSKTEVSQAYGDTKSAKEEYTYDNNLLKTLKIWNRDNTGYLQETYSYDDFGNTIQKIVSSSIDTRSQTTKTEYDSKGRFVTKKIDNLQLETNYTYNNWGQVLTQTDPLNNTLINTYDGWGKILTAKTNTNGTTSYKYEKDSNANITVIQYDPDGDISKKYTNKLGQDYKTSAKAFGQGQFVSKDIQYDVLGRKTGESEPYFDGQSNIQWSTINYDDSVFPVKVTAQSFNGKQIETTISGLTTFVKEVNPADYGRIRTKTIDALGNVISTTDKGGIITFSYNAAGEQIKAQYAENIVTTKYDIWGRKSELNDPSNGTYKYEYDGFGQPKKIISPKGTKEFTYNNLGQLITQKELSTADGGQATNKTITLTYDDKGRVISRSGTSKGKAYSSNVSFDPQGRVLSLSEQGNGKYFIQKGITYDDKGRVISYEKQLYSSGAMTKLNIENVYSAWSGEMYQIKDQTSGKVLWQLKETNAKGQVVSARLGAVDITNNYNPTTGLLSNTNHLASNNSQVLQMTYTFDAIRNELKTRTRGGDFNITEQFNYDDNNRLINWTNPVTGQISHNTYDIKGRITENDQVGTIKYENSAKIYQPTGMTLNAAGEQNYNNDLIQTIVYNENNDPVFIDGMKGDVAFQYGLTSMRQRVTYGGNFAADGDGTFTKFYSEDGSYEVQVNNTTGAEKHVLYIGGSPYESNIVFIKNYGETSGSYKFLHKDYLGSILAITDETGNKLEQRHFDAWGNMTHYKKGIKSIVTDRDQINMIIANGNLLIDRGYTGHEYFPEVGIIHMNGRLYDPLLRRFLNADENIQDPTNTQNYNKYGYVLNNPLMYNDPSGELIFLAPLASFIVAAVMGAAVYTLSVWISGDKFNILGMFSSIVMSTLSAGIGGVLGSAFSTSSAIANQALSSLANAAVQGTLSLMQGGNFFTAAASAFVASVISFGYAKAFGSGGYNLIGQTVTGMISGGIGSVLTGGNFWQGVKIGGMVAIVNYLANGIASMATASSSSESSDQQNNIPNDAELLNPGSSQSTGAKALRILSSFIAYDSNKTFFGKAFQILSHFTWELPQMILGTLTAEITNLVGGIGSVDRYSNGSIVAVNKWMGGDGITMGNIITIGPNTTFDIVSHEFGHYIQSRRFGPLWTLAFGIPSFGRAILIRANIIHPKSYTAFYTESNADKLGEAYSRFNE